MTEAHPVLAALLERCRADHWSWINGDGSSYALPGDGTILGGIGGYARGGPQTAARQTGVAARWQSGSGELEYLNGAADGAVAWLTFIERAVVVFDGDPVRRRWDLRVTEVFRRSDDGWERVHRHADPLVERGPLDAIVSLFAEPAP
jgi:ketosteroid isomerase-like protein